MVTSTSRRLNDIRFTTQILSELALLGLLTATGLAASIPGFFHEKTMFALFVTASSLVSSYSVTYADASSSTIEVTVFLDLVTMKVAAS